MQRVLGPRGPILHSGVTEVLQERQMRPVTTEGILLHFLFCGVWEKRVRWRWWPHSTPRFGGSEPSGVSEGDEGADERVDVGGEPEDIEAVVTLPEEDEEEDMSAEVAAEPSEG